MPFAWSPAALDDLHRLYVREKRSAAETARLIGGGLTRGAVLGKAQRLGWTKPPRPRTAVPEPPRRDKARPSARPRRGPFAKEIPLPRLREAQVAATPRPWTERRVGECAFPVGEPAEPGRQYSCCAPTIRGGAYCPAHRALMVLEASAMSEHDRAAILEIARRAA